MVLQQPARGAASSLPLLIGSGNGRQAARGAGTRGCFLFAFDLLELNGQDLRREPLEVRKRQLATLLRNARLGLQLNEHLEHEDGAVVFRHACKMGLEGIVSKRLGSPYWSGRSHDWLKMKNPAAPAVRREAEEDWGKRRWK